MGKNSMVCNHEWSSRPDDQRYWTFDEMLEKCRIDKENSEEGKYPVRDLRVTPKDDNDVVLLDANDREIQFTNYSFGQTCASVGVPADYMKKLPATLVARNLNYCLKQQRKDEELQLLLQNYENATTKLCSMTTGLNRLYDYDFMCGLERLFDSGWVVPPARPSSSSVRTKIATKADILPNQESFALSVKEGDTIAPAGLYKSDRDAFVFAVNPDRVIDDGGKGVMRGFYARNSEVGAGKLSVTAFYLENVCSNHIIWGMSNEVTVSVAHRGRTSFIMKNALRELEQQMMEYANKPESFEQGMIIKAKSLELGKDREGVIEGVLDLGRKTKHGLNKREIGEALDYAVEWESTAGAPPNSLWGFHHGLTRYSQTKTHTDERTRLDRSGGRLLAICNN